MMQTTNTTRRARSLVALSAAVLLLPGLLAACSSGTPKAEQTSSGSKSGTGSSLASCMRDKGYDMKDPSGGGQTLRAPDGVDEEQWSDDMQACMGGSKGAGDSGVQKAKPVPGADKKMQEVAKCIRAGGFSDYPDDQGAQASYKAGDRSAFEDLARQCEEKAFGTGGTKVEP